MRINKRLATTILGLFGTLCLWPIICNGARSKNGDDPQRQDAMRITLDAKGSAILHPPRGWTLIRQWDKDGRRHASYAFPLRSAPGSKAVADVTVWQVARAIAYSDLKPDEVKRLEAAGSELFAEVYRSMEEMPGVDLVSGGSQFIYTAIAEDGKRYLYQQRMAVIGVDQEGNSLRPAFSTQMRCRNALDQQSRNHEKAGDEMNKVCADAMFKSAR